MPADRPAERSVLRVDAPPPMHWVGDGFPVRSLFSYVDDPASTSPFLLLDYAAPMEFEPTRDRRGVGPHPHRGFETVTLAYAGEIEHRDSAGHRGSIGPGDVQWMTAGSGVLHEELQSRAFGRRGGVLEMAQVWVNLPAKDKRTAPRYQDLTAATIPVVDLPEGAGRVRVIAGEVGGRAGPAKTWSPIQMWDVHVEPRRTARLKLPDGHTALLLVRRGPIVVGDAVRVDAEHLVRLSRTGGGFRVGAADAAVDVLVLAGAPIDEPVVGHGPFVMNTWEEITRAIHDVQAGRMGTLEATVD